MTFSLPTDSGEQALLERMSILYALLDDADPYLPLYLHLTAQILELEKAYGALFDVRHSITRAPVKS